MARAGEEDRWAEIAYEAIAPAYDEFTAHHDYEVVMDELLPVLERHGLTAGSLLDVGCGTGKSFLPMLSRGWEVTACDISPAMVALARGKVDDSVRIEVADMRKLPAFGEFDLVWAVDDAINYLLNFAEIRAALAGMRDNLAPAGLLQFDVNTLLTYRSFASTREVVERDGLRLTRQGLTSAEEPAGSIWLSQFEAEGAGKKVEAHLHRQRHFPEEEMLRALRSAGLQVLDVFGKHAEVMGLKQPLDESKHTKAIYVACRAEES